MGSLRCDSQAQAQQKKGMQANHREAQEPEDIHEFNFND